LAFAQLKGSQTYLNTPAKSPLALMPFCYGFHQWSYGQWSHGMASKERSKILVSSLKSDVEKFP
jgi:hypothetical protein